MGKVIHLHIGAHKTGTSAAQWFLTQNRAELARRGILYPESCNYRFAQHRLAFALKGERRRVGPEGIDFETEIGGLKAEFAASRCGRVILSSEAFFSLPVPQIARLRRALADEDIRIVAVLRRPDQLFESLYNQKIRIVGNAYKRPYGTFLENPLGLDDDLDFERALVAWEQVFGREAMCVRCYEDAPDIVALLAEVMSLPLDGLDLSHGRRHDGLSVRAAELIRQGKLVGLDEELLKELKRIAEIRFPKSEEVGGLLSPAERLGLLRQTDAMTAAVAARYLGVPNPYDSRRFRPRDLPPQATLTLTDAVAIIADLLRAG